MSAQAEGLAAIVATFRLGGAAGDCPALAEDLAPPAGRAGRVKGTPAEAR